MGLERGGRVEKKIGLGWGEKVIKTSERPSQQKKESMRRARKLQERPYIKKGSWVGLGIKKQERGRDTAKNLLQGSTRGVPRRDRARFAGPQTVREKR